MDNTEKNIFSIIAGTCLFTLFAVSVVSTGFMTVPDNTEALPTTKVAMYGPINRKSAMEKALPGSTYSWKDITCLARNIYFEARSESILGQHAVAWVTVNRVKHKKWPNNVCDVVYQNKQFSWTIKYKKNKVYDKLAYSRAVLIAKDTLHEFYTGGKDLSKGALYYHTDYVEPNWDFNQLKMIAQVDTHIFYKYKTKQK